MTSLTRTSFFFITFFSAVFVKTVLKIPTPYSCSRTGEGILGTIVHTGVLVNGFLGVLEEGKNGRYNYYLVVEINSISDFRVKDFPFKRHYFGWDY